MLWFLAFIVAAFLSVSVTVWLISKMIDKSNNKGDSKADFYDFATVPLVIDDREDNQIRKIPLR